MRIADELGVEFEEVDYIRSPPNAETLRAIIAKLEDPPTALVRRDSKFKKLELRDADVATVDQVVVSEDAAIVGRPTDRVRTFLSEA